MRSFTINRNNFLTHNLSHPNPFSYFLLRLKYIKINIYKPWLDDLKITRVNLDRLRENPYRWSKGGISLDGKWFETQRAYTSEDIFVNSAYSYDITDLTKNTNSIKFSEFDVNGNFMTRRDFNIIQSFNIHNKFLLMSYLANK